METRIGLKNNVKTDMDNLSYAYQANTNKLSHVNDNITASTFDNDIDNQTANNYTYDAIGNLIRDNAEGITNITWNVYGKMTAIVNTTVGKSLTFAYDAAGNRVRKQDNSDKEKITYYVRDAQGNVMAVYEKEKNKDIFAQSFYIYGSSRVGELDAAVNMATATVSTSMFSRTRGVRRYEMSNHLGNVMVVVSDRKVVQMGGTYLADLVSTTDYYAFGMVMSDRSWNTEGYRFGFNGMGNDNEVKGMGNSLDFRNRIYDTKIGRFLSIDPHANHYSELSLYVGFMCNPIFFVDPDGRDVKPTKSFLATEYGKVYEKLRANNDSYNGVLSKYISSKAYNLVLSDDEKEVTSTSLATTKSSPLVQTTEKGKKSIVGIKSDSYYSTPKTTDIFEQKDAKSGKTYIITQTRTEIGLAKTIIHEAIHSKIAASTFDDDDTKHDYYHSNHFNTLLGALKEFNVDNKFGYTDEQLEALTWEGLHSSKAFKNYIEEKAKTNSTTYDEEYKKWSKLRSSIAFKTTFEEKKDVGEKKEEVKKQ